MKKRSAISILITTFLFGVGLVFASCGKVKKNGNGEAADASVSTVDASVLGGDGGSQDCVWDQNNWDGCSWAP